MDEFDLHPEIDEQDLLAEEEYYAALERDEEYAADLILERQELEDFEQADEYFNGGDFGDHDGDF